MKQLTLFILDKPKSAEMKITGNLNDQSRTSMICAQMQMALLLSSMYVEGLTKYDCYDKKGNVIKSK